MADKTNPYAAGDKVYNGGSSAATQGAVDPTGYIDRSLENTTYSPGVAAAALQTIRDNATPEVTAYPSSVVSPTQTPTTTQANTVGSISWKMPVDYDLQVKGIQQSAAYQNLLTQIAALRNSASQERTIGLRDVQNYQQEQQRKDLNNAAYRGMARSSGYVGQVDKTAQYLNNLRSDIETKFMAALNDATAQDIQGKTELDSIMEAIYQEAARRLADKVTTDPNAGALDPLSSDTPAPTPINNTPPGSKATPAAPAAKPKTTTTKTTTVTKAAAKPATTKVVSYTVKSGDTLWDIAKKYGISLADLKAANPHLAGRNYAIYSGSTVHIPK